MVAKSTSSLNRITFGIRPQLPQFFGRRVCFPFSTLSTPNSRNDVESWLGKQKQKTIHTARNSKVCSCSDAEKALNFYSKSD